MSTKAQSLQYQGAVKAESSESLSIGAESCSATDKVGTSLAPIYSLPFDILYAIFIICEDHSADLKIIVSQVCQHWRSVAIASSALWSNIRFTHARRSWEKYEVWLERSREAPLTIEMSGAPFKTSSIKTLKRILRLILPHTTRWLSITVNDVPEKIFRILIERIRLIPLPMLRRIHLFSLDEDKPAWRPLRFVHGTPALRDVALIHAPINLASSILSNLTTLTISIYDPRTKITPPLAGFKALIQSLLIRSPNLHTLHIITAVILSARDIPVPSSSTLLVHSGLSVLETPPSTALHLLQEVQASGLSKIESNKKPTPLSISLFSTFAQWSTSSSLGAAHFYHGGDPTGQHLALNYMPAALGVLSALECLHFDRIDFGGDRPELLACLGRLCPQLKDFTLDQCRGVSGAEICALVTARHKSGSVARFQTLLVVEVVWYGPRLADDYPLIVDDDTMKQIASMRYKCKWDGRYYHWTYRKGYRRQAQTPK